MIIGITGEYPEDNNVVAKALVQNRGFVRLSFLDKAREVAVAINPLISTGADQYEPLADLVRSGGWLKAMEISDVQEVLRRVVEGAGRNTLGEGVWVNATMEQVQSEANYAVLHVQYPNEIEAIKSRGGLVWRIVRPGDSEKISRSNLEVDLVLSRSTTLEALAARVLELVGPSASFNEQWKRSYFLNKNQIHGN